MNTIGLPQTRGYHDLLGFAGRAAVVTGGGSGMGAATARRLSELGARVAVVDIDAAAAKSVAEDLVDGVAVEADVSDEDSVRGYVAATVDAFGRIDAFFNNAGLLGRASPIVDSTVDDFEKVFGVNTRGVWLGLRAVAQQMIAQGDGGSIVNTASIAGLRSSPGVSIYAASKWAVIGLTRTAAKEYGSKGIRVNGICPGITVTNFSATGRDPAAAQREEQTVALIPSGRFGHADDIARAAVWLLSDAATWTTGAILTVDGGQTA